MNNTIEQKEKWPFIITINDKFSTYEYKFETSEDVSIYDIAKQIAKKLKCEVPEGKLIS